ncbi:MAG: hypothetical protein A2722_00360 [Candidatus Doudnabacteria bacterium RIFCSPHIGHO2_01_FULL_50_11]|uniref:Uncharacterized protein n=1 Tax=Candidatus Doudnabacteria bacterium RIFCSPHIGHO2_01_FULL_50_11 TaxID=1817828 RepID=A0A1F5PGX9_9BACT|nr:MAG: hypothetical protein A2722_00360 [Candidatus Doudnabacteria bacterium RIFCSPHIGHO2_01_FULL_50_11]HLC44736.1 hypothetical protein [Patescibacteria group bacterium]
MRSKTAYKICVSGAAAGECLAKPIRLKAEALGRAIAKSGAILTHGATTGLPHEAAKGAKQAHGLVFGFSPASTRGEHMRKYRLPINFADAIIYTGAGYAGRNLILTRSSDAVIVVCGRIGTLNEFTVAYEDKKVIGILRASGGITSELEDILRIAKRGRQNIIFDSDPEDLVRKVIQGIRVIERKHLSTTQDNA